MQKKYKMEIYLLKIYLWGIWAFILGLGDYMLTFAAVMCSSSFISDWQLSAIRCENIRNPLILLKPLKNSWNLSHRFLICIGVVVLLKLYSRRHIKSDWPANRR